MPETTNGVGHSHAPMTSTEQRLLDLLTASLAKQEQATKDMHRGLASQLDRVATKLDRVEDAVSSLAVTPKLLGLVALALMILGGAVGVRVAVDLGAMTVEATP